MAFFDEGEDVAGGFIDRGAAAVKARLGDGDVGPPGEAGVDGTTGADVLVAPGGDEGSFFGDDDVREAFVGVEVLNEGFVGGFVEIGEGNLLEDHVGH